MLTCGYLEETISLLAGQGLLSDCEASQARYLFSEAFPFREQLDRAESIHIHIRVDETADLSSELLESIGGESVNAKEGYIKLQMSHGGHVILSSRPVAQEDLMDEDTNPPRKRPFLDHLGIDLRNDDETARELFNAIPQIANDQAWEHTPQGGNGRPVFCCHVEVSAKHWVYPPIASGPIRTPLEFALGELKVNGEEMGCDLRPANPHRIDASHLPACES